MNVALGAFARSALEHRLGTDVVSGAWAALLHYARRLEEADGATPGFPRFRREHEEPLQPANVLELPLGAGVVAALEGEASRQKITMDQLLQHAVMVYLADIDRVDRPEPVGELRH